MSVSSLNLLSTELILILLLLCIYFTSTNLFFFKLLNAIFFAFVSESLKRVGPVLDPTLAEILKVLAFIVAHGKVWVLESLLNSSFDTIKFVKTNHD